MESSQWILHIPLYAMRDAKSWYANGELLLPVRRCGVLDRYDTNSIFLNEDTPCLSNKRIATATPFNSSYKKEKHNVFS